MDVRKETGIETYVNDEPDDPNPGVIVDTYNYGGRALTAEQARALAQELLERADYFDSVKQRDLTFTRGQVEAWVGHSLTDDEVESLEDALPNSSLPDCVETVAHEALGIDYRGEA